MQESFNKKVAIITGAGTGIGFEIARQLCLQGTSVLLNDIDERKAARAADKIQSEGGKCLGLHGDAGDLDFIGKLLDEAIRRFGQLDFCIANAGITSYGDFFSYSPEQFRQVVDVNLSGTFFLVQAAARYFRKRGNGGKILLMSSNIGLQAYPYLTAYSMSKAALQMMAKSLVLELSPHGININALAPGATLTERTLEEDANYASHWKKLVPLQKAAKPIDIASAALFLLSSAADHITGQTLVVDGGWTNRAHYPPEINKH